VSFGGRFGLTWLFATTAAVAFLALGYVLTHRLVSFTTDTMFADEGDHARVLIAPQVRNFLSPGDFDSGLPPDRWESLDRFVRTSILSEHIAQVTIWGTHGDVLYSSDTSSIGKTFPPSQDLMAAVAGQTLASTIGATAGSHVDEGRLGKHFEIYTPILFPGAASSAGVLELNQPYGVVTGEISGEQQRIVLALTGGLGMLYLTLVGIVYGGSRTIRGQQAQLVQASHAQARNEKERDRLVAILESTPDAVGIIDLVGRPLYLNRVAREAARSAAVPGATTVTVSGLYPAWAAEIVTGQGIPAATREGTWSGETAVLGPNGEEHPVSQVIIAHSGEDGEVEYLSSIMRDISAQKKVEQELRRSEESFRLLFAANPQALMVHDLAGQMLEANDAALRAYGYTRDEFLPPNESGSKPTSLRATRPCPPMLVTGEPSARTAPSSGSGERRSRSISAASQRAWCWWRTSPLVSRLRKT
jgi:PAS domain-containing protein